MRLCLDPPRRPAWSRSSPGSAARPVLAAGAAWLLAALLLLGAVAAIAAAPEETRPVYPGLDPLLTTTVDPRLLGVERLVARERLLALGIDPVRQEVRPTLATVLQAYLDRELHRTLGRHTETTVESDLLSGTETTLEYPAWFPLFPPSEPLADGFTYWPPRPVAAPEVRILIERLGDAAERRARVSERLTWARMLDARSRQAAGAGQGGLLNLTIPIKLPRTLEKIIGRGEKTNIRVSGREHLSISGESTIITPFVGNERRSKPSLFPNLNMEQQLQINLSGTIGEKIIIEVDHNSEVVGPEATKIKLSYRGTEDELIQTIESGDVGLTLPGSQLLGYSSNKSGLFGVKVTGQFGRADFTVVASKQKAESAAKSFNSKGGEVTEHVIECQNYLRNRFFRLDLQPDAPGNDGIDDAPGRHVGENIDPGSIHIFQFVGSAPASAGTVDNIAAYLDTTGRWESTALDRGPPPELGLRWREVDKELLLDSQGRMIAVDLQHSFEDNALLAVCYTVKDPAGNVIYQVGDVPGVDEAGHRVPLGNEGLTYLRMKLLKPSFYKTANARIWNQALRNIYSLGGTNIDADSFELKIQLNNQALAHADIDTASRLAWVRVFGLDRLRQGGQPGHDGVADKQDPLLFDLQRGLLKFPLNFTRPFAALDSTIYAQYADSSVFDFEKSLLKLNRVPQIYDWRVLPSQYGQYNRFTLVARHAAASGTIDLHDSNIEEGSETVTLDGQTLTRGSDYDIDYNFGQVTLKGDAAARLSADSQIGVNYQYAPFMGGGNSSLLGFNLGFDLAQQSRLAATLLYEKSQIAGNKAKLGEEPSRTLVGNLNLTHTFTPYFLTRVANFLSRKDSDRESSLQLSGEVAASVPNPNTMGDVYLEDFEGIDASDVMPIGRLSWMWGAVPAQGQDPSYTSATHDPRNFLPEDRTDVRWFLPKDSVQRRFLNPDLKEVEGKEPQQVLQLWMDAGASGWHDTSWGGIERGLGRNGLDLSKAQFLEFWVNDFRSLIADRRGTLHIDFGYIDEDVYWPVKDGAPEYGTFQREDRNGDGFQAATEDIGLDADHNGSGAPDYFSADFNSYDDPFPGINGTEANLREDTEDLDGDTIFERANGYFSIAVNLADSALVDVLRDYPAGRVSDLAAAGQAWRKFRIRINDARTVSPPGQPAPQLSQVTHVRIWYEDGQPGAARKTQLQLSELKFLGSRWEREGIRKSLTEQLLAPAERGPREAFFLGEVNNKENPDYVPPVGVHVENNISEKESSLVLDFSELERDHVVRVSKYVSPRGDDYTQYSSLRWYLFNPRADQSDLDTFFRVGSDSLNYYEVRWRFEESRGARTGWHQFSVGLAELSNLKLDPEYPVKDHETGQTYRVRVVGRPDLRRVKRYYFGVENDRRDQPVSGQFYLDDVRLEQVKRERGFAERVAARLNMAEVIKVDFDWSSRDANFHGLNASRGQGFKNQDWNLTTSLRADDFVPLLGFQVPINLSRRQGIQRPKYLTNDDVELIDDGVINAQSTIDTRDSYSVSISHEPSRSALPRYLIDPWRISWNSANSTRNGPLDRSRQENSQGSFTYDLRIAGLHKVGDYFSLARVPILGDFVLAPRKITLGGSISSGRQASESLALDGSITPRPLQYSRRGSFNGAVEYAPLPVVDLSVNVKSDRDLLRPQSGAFGLNVGRELMYTQGVQVRFNPPKASQLPDTWLLRPVKAGIAALNSMRPAVTFNGQFTANRDPGQRQLGDPEGVRSVSNGGDWDFRVSLPIDKFIKSRFPAGRPVSEAERQQTIERQRRLQRRGVREGAGTGAEPPPAGGTPDQPPPGGAGGTPPPAGAEVPGTTPPPGGGEATGTTPPPDVTTPPASAPVPAIAPDDETLTAEERQRREEEALLEQARQQEERERAEREAAGPDSTAARGPAAKSGGFRFPNPAQALLGVLREMSPVQASYSLRRASSYTRLAGPDDFWFRAGLASRLALPDTALTSAQFSDRATKSLSTSLKLARTVTADVKFSETKASADGGGLRRENYEVNWPDLRLAVSGLERWRIFGGGAGDGWFRASNLDIGYKFGKTVQGATATIYNPRTTKSITPRWNFTFASGLSASINAGYTHDENTTNGTISESNRTNIGLQIRHQFRAERILAKLHLYKPGSTPSISLDFDVNYGKDTDQRRTPGSTVADARTGQSRLSVNPRFSYQVTRNLSGALRFIYSRNKVLETNTTTTTFGLGLEATFVF